MAATSSSATRQALYERPRTRFVAGFLGVSNLLPRRRRGHDGTYAAVRLADDTRIRVPAALVERHGQRRASASGPRRSACTS